jgi:hypothetical protein
VWANVPVYGDAACGSRRKAVPRVEEDVDGIIRLQSLTEIGKTLTYVSHESLTVM